MSCPLALLMRLQGEMMRSRIGNLKYHLTPFYSACLLMLQVKKPSGWQNKFLFLFHGFLYSRESSLLYINQQIVLNDLLSVH